MLLLISMLQNIQKVSHRKQNKKNNKKKKSSEASPGIQQAAFAKGYRDHPHFVVPAIVGTSAGAINAVLLAAGLAAGGLTHVGQKLEEDETIQVEIAPSSSIDGKNTENSFCA